MPHSPSDTSESPHCTEMTSQTAVGTEEHPDYKEKRRWFNQLGEFYKIHGSKINNRRARADMVGKNPVKEKSDSKAKPTSEIKYSLDIDGVFETTDVNITNFQQWFPNLCSFVVAVTAFRGVVKLELTRRANIEKLKAVRALMNDVLSVLFDLIPGNTVSDTDIAQAHDLDLPTSNVLSVKLTAVIEEITVEILKFGSACDCYEQKDIKVKYLLSTFHSDFFASCAVRLSELRSKLQLAIMAYMATNVHTNTQKLDDMKNTMKVEFAAMKEHLDEMASPREKEVSNFMRANGGAQACVHDPYLFATLIRKMNGVPVPFSDKEAGMKLRAVCADAENPLSADEMTLQSTFIGELQLKFDAVIENHMGRFRSKVNIAMENQEKQLIQINQSLIDLKEKLISLKFHDQIQHPTLKLLWQILDPKGSVKARNFVLALRDYFTGQIYETALRSGNASVSEAAQQDKIDNRSQDYWALKYLNIENLQSVMEALDDDGSGFISVKEANSFVKDCPEDWSLLLWLAYWGAGWHMSISSYASRIRSILQDIRAMRNEDLPLFNRSSVHRYISDISIQRIEQLLLSTNPLHEKTRNDHRLKDLVRTFAKVEEGRLEARLSKLAYIIDTPSTVNLLIESGRIERYIYPLLHFVLKRHKELLECVKNQPVIVQPEEFRKHSASLNCIFAVFDERCRNIEAMFRQMRVDPKHHFVTFAFGMFRLSFENIGPNILNNDVYHSSGILDEFDVLREDNLTGNAQIEVIEDKSSFVTQKIKLPKGKSLSNNTQLRNLEDDPSHSIIEGPWIGHCLLSTNERIAYQGHFQCNIRCTSELEFEGEGESYLGSFKIIGNVGQTIHPWKEEETMTEITMNLMFSDEVTLYCIGYLPSQRDTKSGKKSSNFQMIEGGWFDDMRGFMKDHTEEQYKPNAIPFGNLQLFRSSPEFYRFRPLLQSRHYWTSITDVHSRQPSRRHYPEESNIETTGEERRGPIDSLLQQIKRRIAYSNIDINAGMADSPIQESPDNLIIPGNNKSSEEAEHFVVNNGLDGNYPEYQYSADNHPPTKLENQNNVDRIIIQSGRAGYPTDEFGSSDGSDLDSNTHKMSLWDRIRNGIFSGNALHELPYEWNESRIRWFAVCSAILYQILRSRRSMHFTMGRCHERRRWIELSLLREYDKENYQSAHREVVDKTAAELFLLRRMVSPLEGHIFNAIVEYMKSKQRIADIFYVGGMLCALCGRRIIKQRLTCITCVSAKLDFMVDYCIHCAIEMKSNPGTFLSKHRISHSLLCYNRPTDNGELALLIPEARRISEKIKSDLRDAIKRRFTNHKSLPVEGAKDSRQAETSEAYYLRCHYCRQGLTAPCYTCIICPGMIVVCAKCRDNTFSLKSERFPWHSVSHPILLIQDEESCAVYTVDESIRQAMDTGRRLQEIEQILRDFIENNQLRRYRSRSPSSPLQWQELSSITERTEERTEVEEEEGEGTEEAFIPSRSRFFQ
ncbi:hypothetical protein M422DRAFT_248793 [Sphaerobolus stellatus SS14]|nr:hypothetical protein M422DRAFT_248793 [Sphaerobolus stellatus SS14]